MTLRELNHWDFFKLILIIEFLIGIILIPVIILIAFFFSTDGLGSAVTVNGEPAGSFSIATIVQIFVGFLISIILAMFKASVLTWICQITRLGNIQIGNTKFGRGRLAKEEASTAG